jgi:hypothetical protein
VVLEKKLPIGNRNAMRRDWFTYMADCNETLEEFQALIDEGPELREEDEEGQETTAADKSDYDAFEDFMGGHDQIQLGRATDCHRLRFLITARRHQCDCSDL